MRTAVRALRAWQAKFAAICVGATLQCGSSAVSRAQQPDALVQPPAGLAAASGDYAMCARVYTSDGGQRAFCASSDFGRGCLGATALVCTDDGGGTYPWYQAAIYWARDHGHSRVGLDAGTITITNTTKLAWGFPWNAGVGIHVPPGIHLEGSMVYDLAPTIINVANSVDDLSAVVLVHDKTGMRQLSDASVSYLTLVGTTTPGRSRGELCPSRGHRLESILELDDDPPRMTVETGVTTGKRRYTVGVHVGEANNTGPAVNVHHMRITHLGVGVAYGWNTNQIKEDPSCVTEPGIEIKIEGKVDVCPKDSFEKKLGISRGARKSAVNREENSCGPSECSRKGDVVGCLLSLSRPDLDDLPEKQDYCVRVSQRVVTARYCANKPFEFLGNPQARAQVHHNSICDVNVGANIVGGNVDVNKNVVIRYPTDRTGVFGLSTDGHWPYSSSTTHTENYVAGFQMGFLTDGSQYAMLGECDFKKVTGYYPSDFFDPQDWLDLQQIIFDDAQEYFVQSDPWRGFIDHVHVRDNRFLQNATGISLYRVNWGHAGFNVIRSPIVGCCGKGSFGVSVSNTTNSWIYGNRIEDFRHGIDVFGTPGQQSSLGSCYNGIGVFCSDPGCPQWGRYPNVFSGSDIEGGVACNVVYGAGHCNAPGVPPFTPLPPGAPYQCFAE